MAETGIIAALWLPAYMRNPQATEPDVERYDLPDEPTWVPPEPVDELRLMTLNLAHGRGGGWASMLHRSSTFEANLSAAAEVIRREQPHVVALQEADGPSVWSGNFDHVHFLARKAGFPHSLHTQHVSGMNLGYGTALLTRGAPVEPQAVTFAPSPPTFCKGLTLCRVQWPGPPALEVDVGSVHLDFASSAVREKQAREIVRHLSPRRCPLVLMGDFNCEWRDEERTLHIIAEGLHLQAYRPMAPSLETLPRLGTRLDWVLVSPELQFSSYRVLPDPISDHRGVVCEIRTHNSESTWPRSP